MSRRKHVWQLKDEASSWKALNCTNMQSYMAGGNRWKIGVGGAVERDLCWVV